MKRVYEPASKEDGYRILVDRIWPRGFTKERAHVDEWRKDLAPSHTLRKWYAHDPKKWDEFRRRYRAELEAAGKWGDLERIGKRAAKETVTLVFGSREMERNQAVALRMMITGR